MLTLKLVIGEECAVEYWRCKVPFNFRTKMFCLIAVKRAFPTSQLEPECVCVKDRVRERGSLVDFIYLIIIYIFAFVCRLYLILESSFAFNSHHILFLFFTHTHTLTPVDLCSIISSLTNKKNWRKLELGAFAYRDPDCVADVFPFVGEFTCHSNRLTINWNSREPFVR